MSASSINFMEIYDPTDDILRFRDFKTPWVRVDCVEQEVAGVEGLKIRPIAFNARDQLVLFHNVGPSVDCALSMYSSASPEGPRGKEIAGYENIWHFVECWQRDVKREIT